MNQFRDHKTPFVYGHGVDALMNTAESNFVSVASAIASLARSLAAQLSPHRIENCKQGKPRWNKADSFQGWLKVFARDLRARRVNRNEPPKPSKTKDEGSGTAVALMAN